MTRKQRKTNRSRNSALNSKQLVTVGTRTKGEYAAMKDVCTIEIAAFPLVQPRTAAPPGGAGSPAASPSPPTALRVVVMCVWDRLLCRRPVRLLTPG